MFALGNERHWCHFFAPPPSEIYADSNYEYPVRAGVAVNPTIAGYGKLTADPLPIARIAANRKAASTLVDKIGFDN